MKHAAISVAVDAVGSVKQKAKLNVLTSAGNNTGARKASTFQFWRWVALLTGTGCILACAMWVLLVGLGDMIRGQQSTILLQNIDVAAYNKEGEDVCLGRRIYLYEMPPQFNEGVLEDMCLDRMQWLHMCDAFVNEGFGPKLEKYEDPEAWFITEQISLEVILHRRLQKYECLTNNPNIADLYFLPYYVGLDVSQYLFSPEIQLRDLLTERFFGWLLGQPTWTRLQGHKHFMALSRIIWDFTRQVQSVSWGNPILSSYELQNMTKLLVERDPFDTRGDQIAMPYPSAFHPESELEIESWQKKVATIDREFLVAFSGAPRNATEHPNMKVRDVLFEQCNNSASCTLLHCNKVDCPKSPHLINNLFLTAKFCFQPPGDSPTRKAIFDCLVAGTIPVFFNPHSAYTQYLWHLPPDGSSYSVIFDEAEVSKGNVDVIEQLAQIPEEKVKSMQKIIHEQIIPSILYTMPTQNSSKKKKDAFDLVIEHLFDPKFVSYPGTSPRNFSP